MLVPQHRSEPLSFEFTSSDQHEVLQLSLIVNSSAFFCFQPFLDHIKPLQSEVDQNSVIFDLYNPSKIISEGISLTDKNARSHQTSKSWTSSFCKLTMNKSESPCTASWAPVARKHS